MRNFQLQQLIEKLYKFDYYTCFSDDHSVYVNGQKNEEILKEDIEKLKLSKEEKEKILRVLGYRFDANYLESKEFYNCVPDLPLFNDSSLKETISFFLKMN
jgi:hypothetical protein